MVDWPAIVAEHGPLVWRTVRRLTGTDADAADAFQQTFLAAAAVGAKEPVRDWPAVLRRVATARALDCIRSRVRSRSRFVPLPDAAVDAKADEPLTLAAAGELAEALRVALAELPEDSAAAFCLTALDGLSYPEAGTSLGITANHVGVLVHRARAALRPKLRAFAPGPLTGDPT
jgi:RNA polymerase sigma-70 factor (ECF subfamily)